MTRLRPCGREWIIRFAVGLMALMLATPTKSIAGEPDEDHRARSKAYYSTWVGVQAPEIGQYRHDRQSKPVSLSSFRGKRVLLFSFEAGGAQREPDEKALLAMFRALDKARQTVGPDKLAVVGFTTSAEQFWPGKPKPDGELGRLSDFPIVTPTRVFSQKANEPYNLLEKPGAVLIDSNGILRAFYNHPMTEQELLDAVVMADWDKPAQPAPVEDPWSGKGPPKPTHIATVAWSRTIPRVVGMTGGDWDLRESNDLIAAAAHADDGGDLMVIDPEDGKERHKIPSTDFSDRLPYALGWAKVGKEKSAIFITYSGWPKNVPIIGRDGAPIWTLNEFPAGVDSVAWADLDGNGSKTVIVGLNGGGGLHTFHDGGKKRWSITPRANIWTVAGIDAIGERPGHVIYSDGTKISVLDSRGDEVGTISTEGHEVTKIAATEMDAAGERQVVAVWQADIGTLDYAVATDLKGKAGLWKYPVNFDEMNWMSSTIIAADVTGDGTKEWIISPNYREVVVLDARGAMLARFEVTGTDRLSRTIEREGEPPLIITTPKRWAAWTAIERKGKPGWIVTAESGKVSAFTLAPTK